jgi:hypothetical protein
MGILFFVTLGVLMGFCSNFARVFILKMLVIDLFV